MSIYTIAKRLNRSLNTIKNELRLLLFLKSKPIKKLISTSLMLVKEFMKIIAKIADQSLNS
nr:helix-turn-helix domain-containing protein [Halanaerobium congolense]